MYVMKTRPGYDFVTDEGTWREKKHYMPPHLELIEMTAAEFKAATGPNPPAWTEGHKFRKYPGQRAHEWVRNGGHHMTALYMGEDRWGRPRIKYAKDGC